MKSEDEMTSWLHIPMTFSAAEITLGDSQGYKLACHFPLTRTVTIYMNYNVMREIHLIKLNS